jgi:hypothetical protein
MFDMNDKPKNNKLKNDAPRLGNLLFLVLWIAGHIASWILAVGVNKLMSSQGIFIHGDLLLIMLMALGTGIPTSIVQLLLVERGLKKAMRGWLPVSIIGWVLSGLAFYWTWDHVRDFLFLGSEWINALLPRLLFLPLFVPVALLQWVWLRRKAKSASLWMLSALTGSLLFAMSRGSIPFYFGGWSYLGYALLAGAALLYSGVTGATMLYLWTQSHEKAKNEAAQAEQSAADDAGRLERLTDKEAETQSLLDMGRSANAAKTTL